jgi:aspartate-semialdehyde dehydrogenase
MAIRWAVVGATGAVGQIVLEQLGKTQAPIDQIKLLASSRSAGSKVNFRGESHTVELLTPESFEGVDIVIGSTPDDVAAEFVPWAVERGATVIDESAFHRMFDDVPLVVPEVNAHALTRHQGIIASPNCSTTQMVVALKPLHDAARVRRVVVSTYQATSGAGVAGCEELRAATQSQLAGSQFQPATFRHPIAFNLIPQIGSPKHEGYTSEEMKMVWETRKIFEDDSLEICPTCVRVPVANCHSESILVETERPLTVDEARDLFRNAPGIVLMDDVQAGEYPMPINCDGRNETFVGRVRRDISSSSGLAFWCVSDNLRKGAATNAVQIAELVASGRFAKCGSSN